MITIVKQEKTCDMCPSQWDLWTDDGKYIYVRYRWGTLSIHMGDSEDDVWNVHKNTNIYCERISDGLDGYMTLEELKEYTKDLFIWNC